MAKVKSQIPLKLRKKFAVLTKCALSFDIYFRNTYQSLLWQKNSRNLCHFLRKSVVERLRDCNWSFFASTFPYWLSEDDGIIFFIQRDSSNFLYAQVYFWSWLILILWRQTCRQVSEIGANDNSFHTKVQFRDSRKLVSILTIWHIIVKTKCKSMYNIHSTHLKYLFQLRHNFKDTPNASCVCSTGTETTTHFFFCVVFSRLTGKSWWKL